MQEVSKQLAEIVKPMVQNELQTFQQRQKGICQNHGQSAESMYANTSETNSEIMTYVKSQQGPQFG